MKSLVNYIVEKMDNNKQSIDLIERKFRLVNKLLILKIKNAGFNNESNFRYIESDECGSIKFENKELLLNINIEMYIDDINEYAEYTKDSKNDCYFVGLLSLSNTLSSCYVYEETTANSNKIKAAVGSHIENRDLANTIAKCWNAVSTHKISVQDLIA